jgi:hypothetical protein
MIREPLQEINAEDEVCDAFCIHTSIHSAKLHNQVIQLGSSLGQSLNRTLLI